MTEKPKLLKGKLFCISVNNTNSRTNDEKNSDMDDTGVSYNELKNKIIELGGCISPTVHKKVNFLVATDSAVSHSSQRVRKAHKFCIKVLKVSFIDACYSEHRLLPFEKYLYTNIDENIKKYKELSKASVGTSNSTTGSINTKRKRAFSEISDNSLSISKLDHPSIVFECACICHDNGEVSCAWCVGAHKANNDNSENEEESKLLDANIAGKKMKKSKKKHRKG